MPLSLLLGDTLYMLEKEELFDLKAALVGIERRVARLIMHTSQRLLLMLTMPFIISSGTRTAFPMGVAPEAAANDLCLGVGSTPYAAIFSFSPEVL
jgi:hypothetical protein